MDQRVHLKYQQSRKEEEVAEQETARGRRKRKTEVEGRQNRKRVLP